MFPWKQHCNSSANWEWLSRFRVIILAKVSITLEHVSCSLHVFSVKLAHHRGGRVGRRATCTCSRAGFVNKRTEMTWNLQTCRSKCAMCTHFDLGWLVTQSVSSRLQMWFGGGEGGYRHVQTSSLQICVTAKMYWYMLIWLHNICHVIAKSGNRHDFRFLKL